jgi:molybdopterin-guanine dinucleotide biosynthesis protein A
VREGPGGSSSEWTGVVLAGGRSRRFGGVDKTRLPLGGRTLLERAIQALAPLSRTCVVVGSPAAGSDVATLADVYPGGGPLGGILTALEALETSHALVLAVDLPFIPGAVLESLRHAGAGAEIASLQHADGRLALCLSVRRTCLPALRDAWLAGRRRVRDLAVIAPMTVVPVDESRDPRALWNVNDPLTYARALEMAEHDCPAC